MLVRLSCCGDGMDTRMSVSRYMTGIPHINDLAIYSGYSYHTITKFAPDFQLIFILLTVFMSIIAI